MIVIYGSFFELCTLNVSVNYVTRDSMYSGERERKSKRVCKDAAAAAAVQGSSLEKLSLRESHETLMDF